MNEIDRLNLIARRRIEIARSGGLARELEWDGPDPRRAFDEILGDCVSNATSILDIGCGEGRTACEIAAVTGRIVGADISDEALFEARSRSQCLPLVRCDAEALPFADGSFDVVYSRRGPACASNKTLAEVGRVLASGGALVGLECGESHHIEAQEVFGRGTGWPPARPARFALPEALRSAGLELVSFAEYYGTAYYRDLGEFARMLAATPTIPGFDADADAALIRELGRKLATPRGIRDTEHAIVFVAHKA